MFLLRAVSWWLLASRDSPLHTACVLVQPSSRPRALQRAGRLRSDLVVGKNYRLQDIQLSKKPVKRSAASLPLPAARTPLARPLPSTSVWLTPPGRHSWWLPLLRVPELSILQIPLASRKPDRAKNFLQSALALFACLAFISEAWLASRSSFAAVHLRATRYGGHQPSGAFRSEGWWRIPGSNR
jgi:hypothetical protein